MAIRQWYEISCDKCGCGEHFPVGWSWKSQARNTGWIISKYGDFCTRKCLSDFKILNEGEKHDRREGK